jgi:hypothetical protein
MRPAAIHERGYTCAGRDPSARTVARGIGLETGGRAKAPAQVCLLHAGQADRAWLVLLRALAASHCNRSFSA